MRKLGFTLAEVLITLGIIGVIATLTLPQLMSNTAEREYSTALKKGISALTEAVQMQVALENISFDEMVDTGSENTELNTLYTFLVNRMQTERFAAEAGEACQDVIAGDNQSAAADTPTCLGYGGLMSDNVAMFFRDGSALIFNPDESIESHKDCIGANDEETNCFKVVYDTNGFKKPNLLANCEGQNGRARKADAYIDSRVECTSKNFVARDQYPIRLQGVAAYPNSPAARYIFNMK